MPWYFTWGSRHATSEDPARRRGMHGQDTCFPSLLPSPSSFLFGVPVLPPPGTSAAATHGHQEAVKMEASKLPFSFRVHLLVTKTF